MCVPAREIEREGGREGGRERERERDGARLDCMKRFERTKEVCFPFREIP